MSRKDFNEKTGLWIRRNRTERNLSRAQLAEMIGASAVSISNWEDGVVCPSAYFHTRLRLLFKRSLPDNGEVKA